jgi:hypothetical protein
VNGQRHAPAALPPVASWCPLYGMLVGPHGGSAVMRKISPPPGFDPKASRFIIIIVSIMNMLSTDYFDLVRGGESGDRIPLGQTRNRR